MNDQRPRVHFILGPSYGYVRGYHARDLIIEAGGRPVWGSITRAWATTRRFAVDALACAERRGWLVTVEQESPRPVRMPVPTAVPHEEGGLW